MEPSSRRSLPPELTIYQTLADCYRLANGADEMTPDGLRDVWASLDWHVVKELHNMVPGRDGRVEVSSDTMKVIRDGYTSDRCRIEEFTKSVADSTVLRLIIVSAHENGNFTPEGMDRWKKSQPRGNSPSVKTPFPRPNT